MQFTITFVERNVIDRNLLEILRCPIALQNHDPNTDPGRLEVIEDSWLFCADSGRKYAIRDDIPDMLLKDAVEDRSVRLTLEFYDEITAKRYDFEWAEFEDWQIELRQKFISQAKLRSTSPNVLDLACGPGRDLAYFASQGCQVVGADLSFSQLLLAQTKTDVPLVRADMRNLPFRGNTFDSLWCCVALQHVSRNDAPRALGQMSRSLKPGGLLFISVLWGEGSLEVRREIYNNKTEPTNFYKEEEISMLVSGAGFDIEEIYRREAFQGRKTSEFTGGVKTYIDLFAHKDGGYNYGR